MVSNYSAIDSNVLLRIILNDIPEQREKAVILLLSGRNFYVDDVAIMEAAYVLKKCGRSHAEIVEVLEVLLENQMLVYNKSFFDQVFKLYRSHPSLSLDDCCLNCRVMAKGCSELWTFDKKFANQAPIARKLA